MLAFAPGRSATETGTALWFFSDWLPHASDTHAAAVRDVWVLSYTSQAAPTTSAVARLVPNGEISSVMFYDSEHLAVLRAGEGPLTAQTSNYSQY
jgi:hypothetical protein